jgi:hypothetical protein
MLLRPVFWCRHSATSAVVVIFGHEAAILECDRTSSGISTESMMVGIGGVSLRLTR